MPMPVATAMVLIGSTGSGTTFLSHYVATQFDDFAICKRVTTREKRTDEVTGAAYSFVDDSTFDTLLASRQLVHVKFSDFDNAKYGIEQTELAGILQYGKSPIFTCHSIEEAQTLKHFLHAQEIATVCIYVYASERDRKHALIRNGEISKHMVRYHMDVAFKIQAYQKQFADCNYVVDNRYDSQSTEQMRTIVNAIRSGDLATVSNNGDIFQTLKAEIQDMLMGLGLMANEL